MVSTAALFISVPVPLRRPQQKGCVQSQCPQQPPAPQCSSQLPTSFAKMHEQVITSTQAALACEVSLIELSFPAVPNMATAALNQLMDANRAFTRHLLNALRPRFPPQTVHAVFADAAEARLAAKVYGPDCAFRISALPSSPPSFVSDDDGVIAVVQPGFNVDEWIKMENVIGRLPVVAVNPDLDKVRGSYYPKLFYPGLHKAKDRFLCKFVEVYYLKNFSNGGTLLRAFPDIWRLFYLTVNGQLEEVWSGEERPEFRDVEKLLAKKREQDLLR